MTKIQNIGILTSGGDSQGMNAYIRAIARAGIANRVITYKLNGLITKKAKINTKHLTIISQLSIY